ncbi:MAG: bifunctional YncE family protein/alkaline phosphatase family protein [Nitrospirae bacterium]|nr:bifunctional YncE family protein/alkaline phosphatase family protein [Nitrospirota bacterium]
MSSMRQRSGSWPTICLFAGVLTLSGCDEKSAAQNAGQCEVSVPTAEALRKAGESEGSFLLPGGRALTPTGQHLVVGGFPVDVRVHPSLPFAYVANTGYSLRAVQVIDLTTGELVQEVKRKDAFYGLALSPDGKRLYAAGGHSSLMEVYDIGPDGRLAAAGQVEIGGYPAGIAASADGKKLWIGQFIGGNVVEVDAAALTEARKIQLGFGAYSVAEVPQRGELYVTGFRDDKVGVVDLSSGTLAATLSVGGSPQGLAVSPDGRMVYVTVSDGHQVVGIETATRSVLKTVAVGEPAIADDAGQVLPGSSPTGIALDPGEEWLYVVRAGDNAVAIYEAETFMPVAAIPVGWYPTAVAFTHLGGSAAGGRRLVVANGKGVGTGPLLGYKKGDESGKQKMTGTVSLVSLEGLDLPALTAEVERNVRRPSEVYPFRCDRMFPVPARPGGETPIKHVVLIVRENKTYDSELGDLDRGDRDPSLVLFGEDITPNLHSLARRFALHDNFYNDSETSVQGHLWLTSSFVNDYMERTWFEDYRGVGGFSEDAALDRGQPDFGTFFTHLLKHKVSFTNFGEVVGTLGRHAGESVLSRTDLGFPGVFFNTDVKDEEKARYVIRTLIEDGKLPAFVFLLLPNDHTHGTSPGALTPESMVNDNDYATGLIVDAISRSPYWESTAIFIVEDDPQQGADHVEYHRSFLVIASPWAKRGYVSSVHTSFPSLFRTFELILGLPPMNRFDLLATPLWDAFTSTPDLEPYSALPRTVPDAVNPPRAVGAAVSARMDFRGPDRNPLLGDLLWWYRKGSPPAGSPLLKGLSRDSHEVELEDWSAAADGDDDLERDIFDAGWRHLDEYLRAHPSVKADLRPRPTIRRAERR